MDARQARYEFRKIAAPVSRNGEARREDMATANGNAILAMLGINTAVGAVNQVASKAMMKKMNPLSAPDPAALQIVRDYLSRNNVKDVSVLDRFAMMDRMGPHYNPITRSIWTGTNATHFLGFMRLDTLKHGVDSLPEPRSCRGSFSDWEGSLEQ